MSRKRAVNRSRGGIVECFLEAVAVESRITGDPQQPLIRVSEVHDVTSFCAYVWTDSCPQVVCERMG